MSRGQAVFFPLNDPDRVEVLDGSVNALLLMAGFAENSAADGGHVSVRTAGLGTLFSGLVPGVLYHVFNAGPPVPFSAVPPGFFTRSVGGATNTQTLLIDKGVVLQRGNTMAFTPAAIDNTTGAFVVNSSQNAPRTGSAGAAISPFTAIYLDSVSTTLKPLDGTLAHVKAFVGVSDSNTYALGATVTYSPPGVLLAAGVTGLIPGDTWAKDTDGSLVQFAAVGALTYSRLVVDAQSATAGVVVDGPIVQHP